MDTKKYEIRRNLDMYSEKKFAKELYDRDYVPYYPFKDVGIDILATKERKIYNYQLKARSLTSKNEYWFSVKLKSLNKYLKEKNMFYVFCALLSNNQFDFFVLPIKDVHKWFIEYIKGCKTERDKCFLKIRPIEKNKYVVRPIRMKIDIEKYWLK